MQEEIIIYQVKKCSYDCLSQEHYFLIKNQCPRKVSKEHSRSKAYQNFPVAAITSIMHLDSSALMSYFGSMFLQWHM